MIWIYILIFIPLITALRRRDEPSYRSSVMPGNTPILLLHAKVKDYSEFDSGEDRQTSPPLNMKAPLWAERRDFPIDILLWLKSKLPELPTPSPINPAAPPIMRRSNGEDGQIGQPSKMKVPERTHRRLYSLFNSLIDQPAEYLDSLPPILRDSVVSFNEDNNSILGLPFMDKDDLDSEFPLKTKHKNKKKEKKKLREQNQPDWVTDLKDYFKDLINHYGLEEMLQRAKPVIRSIEKNQHVKVRDVDVDEFGEIRITYNEKNKKKSARQRH